MPRRNFLLKLSYNGRDFKGWQRLPGQRTVQGEVEKALARLLDIKDKADGSPGLEIVGAGRTDAGVHAEGQTASFHAFTQLSAEALSASLNSLLPQDIHSLGCTEVDSRFHARLHAVSKTYRYRLLLSDHEDRKLEGTSYRLAPPLDIEAMGQLAPVLTGDRDFRALSNTKSQDTRRRLDRIRLQESRSEDGEPIIDIFFEGPGFLYNQVRIMASLLVEAGRGRLEPEEAARLLDEGRRAAAPGMLPARGLSLVEVLYR